MKALPPLRQDDNQSYYIPHTSMIYVSRRQEGADIRQSELKSQYLKGHKSFR